MGDETNNISLEERKQELEKQLKEIEANYHRVSGALALINQLIKENPLKKPE